MKTSHDSDDSAQEWFISLPALLLCLTICRLGPALWRRPLYSYVLSLCHPDMFLSYSDNKTIVLDSNEAFATVAHVIVTFALSTTPPRVARVGNTDEGIPEDPL